MIWLTAHPSIVHLSNFRAKLSLCVMAVILHFLSETGYFFEIMNRRFAQIRVFFSIDRFEIVISSFTVVEELSVSNLKLFTDALM